MNRLDKLKARLVVEVGYRFAWEWWPTIVERRLPISVACAALALLVAPSPGWRFVSGSSLALTLFVWLGQLGKRRVQVQPGRWNRTHE